MDICEERDVTKQCFAIPNQIVDKLNVVYNASNSMIIFWNRFQIFVYENLNFDQIAITFEPEFLIHEVFLTNNYLMCLDCSGNVHVTSLKFKNPAQKRFKSNFQAREKEIAVCALYKQDYVFSIKIELSAPYLLLNHLSADFPVCNKVLLKFNSQPPPLYKMQEKAILKSYEITEQDAKVLQSIFNNIHIEPGCNLMIISFDGMTVYGGFFSEGLPEDETSLIQLHSCPSDICDIQITGGTTIKVVIGLKSGTLIVLPFEFGQRKPQIIHLNASIFKFFAFDNSVLYTDGVTMWKSDNTYTSEIQFRQLHLKLPRDFIKFGDQVVCVTFSNIIYLFQIDDESVYVKVFSENDYIPIEKVVPKCHQFDKITTELIKATRVAKEAEVESNYITAMALANRPDVMEKVIQYNVTVYEDYEEAIPKNNNDLILLTNKKCDYYDSESVLFLIKVTLLEQFKLNDVISNLLRNLKLHVSFCNEDKLLKTVSISIQDIVKQMNILVPLRVGNITSVTLKINLVPCMPGALDINQQIFIVLSKREVKFHSEHFVKSSPYSRNVICLQDSQISAEDAILRFAKSKYGDKFNIMEIQKQRVATEWTFYVKLPQNYASRLKSKELYYNIFNEAKAEFLFKKLSSDNFIQSKNPVLLEVHNHKVKLQMIADQFLGDLLKVTSEAMQVAQDFRNFMSNILYGTYEMQDSPSFFIPQSQYAVIEGLQRSLRSCLESHTEDEDRIRELADQFQKNVIGGLPF